MSCVHVLVCLAVVASLGACESGTSAAKSEGSTASSGSASNGPPSAAAVVASPSGGAAASASAKSPAVTASASTSAAASGPCPEGARQNDEARYCITLPPKPLAVSYEGDKPSGGIREELEIAGDRLVITVDPAPRGVNLPQLQADAAAQPEHVDGGNLEHGYWNDRKDSAGQHIVESLVISRYVITCTHWVRDEKKLEAARAVCKSLKTF